MVLGYVLILEWKLIYQRGIYSLQVILPLHPPPPSPLHFKLVFVTLRLKS